MPDKKQRKKTFLYSFDYIGVRTVRASSFEEASKLADMEVPQNFTIGLMETNDPRKKDYYCSCIPE